MRGEKLRGGGEREFAVWVGEAVGGRVAVTLEGRRERRGGERGLEGCGDCVYFERPGDGVVVVRVRRGAG